MLLLLLVPLLIAAGAFILDKKITWKEFLVQVGVQVVIMLLFGAVIYEARLSDTEVWNGVVNRKWSEQVSCRHSYPCNCHEVCSSSGKSESCYTHCDTCYVHSYDVDWNVKSTTQKVWSIDTIDSQGLHEPPRWTQTIVGEPTSETHSFKNYIKASPDTLFRQKGLDLTKFTNLLPEYPLSIYDYYKLDRFIPVNVSVPDKGQWNSDLALLNGHLGPTRQINVVLLAVKDQSPDYFYAIKQTWMGGKKNDTVVVVNVDSTDKITWANIMAVTDRQDFLVVLRDDILKIGKLDRQAILGVVEQDAKLFVRKPMEDYSYLKYLIQPTTTQLVIGLILGILAAIGFSYWMDQEDLFDEQRQNRW